MATAIAYSINFGNLASLVGSHNIVNPLSLDVAIDALSGSDSTLSHVWDTNCNDVMLATSGIPNLPTADNGFDVNSVAFSAAGTNFTLPPWLVYFLTTDNSDPSTKGNIAYKTVNSVAGTYLTTNHAGLVYLLTSPSFAPSGLVDASLSLNSMPCTSLPCAAPLGACTASLATQTAAASTCNTSLTAQTATTSTFQISTGVAAGLSVLLFFMMLLKKSSTAAAAPVA